MVNGVDTANLVDSVPLTEREREVAALVAAGLTNGEISERLGITFATAKWHVSQVLSKLEVEHREEIAQRLAAPMRSQQRSWRWNAWAGVPFLKGLGIAAAVVPVGAVAVAGMLVLGWRCEFARSAGSDAVCAGGLDDAAGDGHGDTFAADHEADSVSAHVRLASWPGECESRPDRPFGLRLRGT